MYSNIVPIKLQIMQHTNQPQLSQDFMFDEEPVKTVLESVQEHFTLFVKKVELFCEAWKWCRGSQRCLEALCVKSSDNDFWFYAEHHFSRILIFILKGKVLLDGKLKSPLDIEEHSEFISKTKSGSYDNSAKLISNVPLTTMSTDYFKFWAKTNRVKVTKHIALHEFTFTAVTGGDGSSD